MIDLGRVYSAVWPASADMHKSGRVVARLSLKRMRPLHYATEGVKGR
jgi:hypothetical protein